MSEIYIFYIHKEPSLEFLNNLKKTKLISNIHSDKNNLLFCDFFNYKKHKIEKADVYLTDLYMNDELEDMLKEVTKWAIDDARNWSEENMEEANETNINKIYSSITSSLIKYEYGDNDIFDFVASVFFKINVTHKLSNGNKRVATSMLSRLLYTFGYRITFSYDEAYNCLYFEDECLKIIEQSSNRVPEDQIIKQIKDWVLSNISLACNVIE